MHRRRRMSAKRRDPKSKRRTRSKSADPPTAEVSRGAKHSSPSDTAKAQGGAGGGDDSSESSESSNPKEELSFEERVEILRSRGPMTREELEENGLLNRTDLVISFPARRLSGRPRKASPGDEKD